MIRKEAMDVKVRALLTAQVRTLKKDHGWSEAKESSGKTAGEAVDATGG